MLDDAALLPLASATTAAQSGKAQPSMVHAIVLPQLEDHGMFLPRENEDCTSTYLPAKVGREGHSRLSSNLETLPIE